MPPPPPPPSGAPPVSARHTVTKPAKPNAPVSPAASRHLSIGALISPMKVSPTAAARRATLAPSSGEGKTAPNAKKSIPSAKKQDRFEEINPNFKAGRSASQDDSVYSTSSRASLESPQRAKATVISRTSSLRSAATSSSETTVSTEEDLKIRTRRGRIIREILSSENVYLGLLKDYLQCYHVALNAEAEEASKAFMATPSLVSLSSNFEQIMHVSAQLLSELTNAMEEASLPSEENVKPKADDQTRLLADAGALFGRVFVQTSSLLKLYGQYAANHSAARRDIKRMTADADFRSFWDRTETDAMLGRGVGSETPRAPSTSTTLDGYLILPIQRVPRYVLLLKELLKATPVAWETEMEAVRRALDDVQDAARFMNECIWRSEQKETLRELQNKFVGASVDLVGGIGPAGYRALVMQGELVRVTAKGGVHRVYHFHLFNDAIIYSKRVVAVGGGDSYRFHRALAIGPTTAVYDACIPDPPGPYDSYVGDTESSAAHANATGSFVNAVTSAITESAPAKTLNRALTATSGLLASSSPQRRLTQYPTKPADAPAPTPQANSRAFRIDTAEKSFVVYASSLALKKEWMDAISRAARESASWPAPVGGPASASAAASHAANASSLLTSTAASVSSSIVQHLKTESCQMCLAKLALFKKRVTCERCGLNVCGTCGGNQRVIIGKVPVVPRPVCCACTWEMDGTAVDAQADEFRLKVWVDDVKSLISHAKGHSFLDSATQEHHPRQGDAAEAFKRLYFSLQFRRASDEREEPTSIRGPTNTGGVGVDAAFSFPLGKVSAERPPEAILRVFVVGFEDKEIARVNIDVPQVLASPSVAKSQAYSKWYVGRSATQASKTVVSTLAVTLVQSKHRDALHTQLSEKERGALRLGFKLSFELQVPPSLWGSHFLHPGAGAVGGAPSTPASGLGTPGASATGSMSARRRLTQALDSLSLASAASSSNPSTNAEIAKRLRRFMSLDDPSSAVGGAPDVAVRPADVESFNPSLLTDYERQVFQRPSPWGLMLTDVLYSDCLARFGALAKDDASRFADTQLSILNRLKVFHAKPQITKVFEQPPSSPIKSTTPPLDARASPMPATAVEAKKKEGRRPSKNLHISHAALSALESGATPRGEEDDEEDGDPEVLTSLAQDRASVIQHFVESEREYAKCLRVLDEVFVTRFIDVAQGARMLQTTSGAHHGAEADAWADKMGLAEGGEGGGGGGAPSASPLRRTLIARTSSLSKSSGGSAPPVPPKISASTGGATASSSATAGSHAVTSSREAVLASLSKPHVVVVLQSVRQIRTVNDELLSSLEERLANAGDEKRRRSLGSLDDAASDSVQVGDVFARFAGVMPIYSSYATNCSATIDELCSTRNSMLHSIVSECEADARSRALDLAEEGGKGLRLLLSLPLTRIDVYHRVLTRLLMCTPRSDPDWDTLRVALGRLVEANRHLTWALRRRENLDRLREIEQSVDGLPSDFNLVDGARWLVREGSLVVREISVSGNGRNAAVAGPEKLRYCWLFNDYLLMAVRNKPSRVQTMARKFGGGVVAVVSAGERKKFSLKRMLKLADLRASDVPRGLMAADIATTSSVVGNGAGAMNAIAGMMSSSSSFRQQSGRRFSMLDDLGDSTLTLRISCGTDAASSLAFFACVPNVPTECVTRRGPAPLERESSSSPTASEEKEIFIKEEVKIAWLEDIVLCAKLAKAGVTLDESDAIHGVAPPPAA